MKTKSILDAIFKVAKEKGLNDVSIHIYPDLEFVLYAGIKDRFVCDDLETLLTSLKEHGDLSWMN